MAAAKRGVTKRRIEATSEGKLDRRASEDDAKSPAASTVYPSDEKVGYYVAAMSPIEDVAEKSGESEKGSASMEPSGAPSEGRLGYNIEALPVSEATDAEGKKGEEPKSGFGWVELNGVRFEHDVIVHADGSVSRRDKSISKRKKEKYSHTPLTRKELSLLEEESPSMIIIGTGQNGAMPLTPKAKKALKEHSYFAGKTPEALERLTVENGRVVALLHVTC